MALGQGKARHAEQDRALINSETQHRLEQVKASQARHESLLVRDVLDDHMLST